MSKNTAMLVIQDNCYKDALHLDEVLLSAIEGACKGSAAFAFATIDGLSAVFGSREFMDYCNKRGNHFELYLGVDSITDKRALDYARELMAQTSERLKVWVYYNKSSEGIFHPKATWLKNEGTEGGCLAFVGSGNLTRGGLQKNVEMFTWIEQDEDSFTVTMNTWLGWLASAKAAGYLYEVDDPEILERAERNVWRKKESKAHDKVSEKSSELIVPTDGLSVIVSQMPKQSGKNPRGWGQYAMKKEYYTDYFGFEILEKDGKVYSTGMRRVLLYNVRKDKSVGSMESRRGNTSSGSNNYRLELEAGGEINNLQPRNPIVVFLKTGERTYLYQLFEDGDPLFDKLIDFAIVNNPKKPKTELPKCRVSAETLRQAFPDIQILAPEVPVEETE